MKNGSPAHLELRKILLNFEPVLNSWISQCELGKMNDPFETIYSENYAPGNASVIYASIYNLNRHPDTLRNCYKMIERSVELLKDRNSVSPFCRVFLLHYSLMAIILLPEDERKNVKDKFGAFYSAYIDDCRQLNTNCASLQYGAEIFLQALGFREANQDYLNYLLRFILSAQNRYGFINDNKNNDGVYEDGMPIAYHSFILFILLSILSVTDGLNAIPPLHRWQIENTIGKGLEWLSAAAAPDGSFATAERSSNQIFTWGIFNALCFYAGIDDELLLNRIIKYWTGYKKPDGSYSCTPNYLHHGARAGFEPYTHVNMYNNLAMTGIVIAEFITARQMSCGNKNIADMFSCNIGFVDNQSGYAFLRNDKSFAGFTLRTHKDRYLPSMSGFNYRINGEKTPLAEAKLFNSNGSGERLFSDGVWEGYLIKDSVGNLYCSDSSENVVIQALADGFSFSYIDKNVSCQKNVRILKDRVEWDYKIVPKVDFSICYHVLPILEFDGRNEIKVLKNNESAISMNYAGHEYQLCCNNSKAMDISLERYLISPSGISTKATIEIEGRPQKDCPIEWKTCLKLDK